MSNLLILVRHGQSVYNQKNLFTGFIDAPLSEEGKNEATKASFLLEDIAVDALFTSSLSRAIKTAEILLKDKNVAVKKRASSLNERDYGDFSGKNKQEVKDAVGEEAFFKYRRSFHEAPPNGESLKDVFIRVTAYFDKEILPLLLKGQTVLVVAHGNSLRALIKHLEGFSDQDITRLEIPTATPIFYEVTPNHKTKFVKVQPQN